MLLLWHCLNYCFVYCVGTPFDVALVRMQADSMKAKDSRRGYKHVGDALVRIYKEEGEYSVIMRLPDRGCITH